VSDPKFFDWQAPSAGTVTEDQKAWFRAALLKKLILSPVADLGFHPASQKLQAFSEECANLAALLEPVLDQTRKLDKGGDRLLQMEQILSAYGLKTFTPELSALLNPAIEVISQRRIALRSMDAEQRDAAEQQEALRHSLAAQFLPLQLRIMSLHKAALYSVESLSLASETAALVVFLLQMSVISEAADKRMYRAKRETEDLQELLDFVVDHAIEAAAWVTMLKPAGALFNTFYHRLQRDDEYDDQMEQFIENAQVDSFVLNYFHWWTEEGGRAIVEGMLPIFSQRLDSMFRSIAQYVISIQELNRDIESFVNDLNRYCDIRLGNMPSMPKDENAADLQEG
jgi:hypothetical protein